MKRCSLCKNFNMTFPTRGYSEMTPGTDGSLSCLKGVGIFPKYGWHHKPLKTKSSWTDLVDLDESDFYEALRTAETCELYEEDERR